MHGKTDNYPYIRLGNTEELFGSTGNDGDWLNEIHLNHKGYEKLADKISRKVRELIGD